MVDEDFTAFKASLVIKQEGAFHLSEFGENDAGVRRGNGGIGNGNGGYIPSTAGRIGKVIVVAPTSVMSGSGAFLKMLSFQTYKVVNTFNFDQPIFELFDQGVLFETITEGKLGGHTGLNSVMQLFGAEVGWRVSEETILCLDGDSEIPKGHVALSHAEQFDSSDRLLIFGEVTFAEFGHKVFERKSEETVAVNGDPVLDTSITEACKDFPYLLIRFDVSGIKISEACLFIFAHHCGREITLQKYRDLGWILLFDNGSLQLSVCSRHGGTAGWRTV